VSVESKLQLSAASTLSYFLSHDLAAGQRIKTGLENWYCKHAIILFFVWIHAIRPHGKSHFVGHVLKRTALEIRCRRFSRSEKNAAERFPCLADLDYRPVHPLHEHL